MRYETWESYFYPETYDTATRQGTLRNLYGERNAEILARLEYTETDINYYELVSGKVYIPYTYDAVHLCAIHSYLFQDVYELAGQYRCVNIFKGVSSFADVHAGQIDRYLSDAKQLIQEIDWSSLNHGDFAQVSAEVFAYINQAHPFREGNGRSSKVFMEHVAQQSQFTFDFKRVSPQQWNQASMLSGPDLGSYKPVPDLLVPVFEVISIPRIEPVLMQEKSSIKQPVQVGKQLHAKADVLAELGRKRTTGSTNSADKRLPNLGRAVKH